MNIQDLSTIGPRKYESKTVPTKVSSRLKKKADTTPQPVAAKKSKRLVVTAALGHWLLCF